MQRLSTQFRTAPHSEQRCRCLYCHAFIAAFRVSIRATSRLSPTLGLGASGNKQSKLPHTIRLGIRAQRIHLDHRTSRTRVCDSVDLDVSFFPRLFHPKIRLSMPVAIAANTANEITPSNQAAMLSERSLTSHSSPTTPARRLTR